MTIFLVDVANLPENKTMEEITDLYNKCGVLLIKNSHDVRVININYETMIDSLTRLRTSLDTGKTTSAYTRTLLDIVDKKLTNIISKTQ